MIDTQVKNKGNVVVLSQEDMQRHEAVMRMKLEEAEKETKKRSTNSQRFYDKNEKQKVAAPVGKR
jgi:hypothetical protein